MCVLGIIWITFKMLQCIHSVVSVMYQWMLCHFFECNFSTLQCHFDHMHCTCRIVLSTWIPPDDKLDSPTVRDSATPTNGVTTPTLEWLKAVLLPKVCQWSEENKGKSPSAGRGKSLVPLSRYSQLYRELKSKYGEHLVKV